METRTVALVAAIVLVIACGVLATGWMNVAEQTAAEHAKCDAKYRRRVTDLPRIVVGQKILYRGEPVVLVEELMRGPATSKIDALYERLVHDQRERCDASWVCLENLIVLQIDSRTTSAVVNQVINTAWAAGFDVVASPVRNNTW